MRRNYKGKKSNLVVRPRRKETTERMIKRFNKKVKKLGIIDEIKERRHYIKPSEQKRLAKKRAIAKRKKEEAKAKRRTN
jgi:small subunit ribosomal protein S21